MNIVEFTTKLFGSLPSRPDLISQSVVSEASAVGPTMVERLEFLGDKEVNAALTAYLVAHDKLGKLFELKNGQLFLTRLIIKYASTEWLAFMTFTLGLDKYIKFCRFDPVPKVFADCFEAFVGACTLSYPLDQVRQMLRRVFDKVNIRVGFKNSFDYKTRMNDMCSATGVRFHLDYCFYVSHNEGQEPIYEAKATVSDHSGPQSVIERATCQTEVQRLVYEGSIRLVAKNYPNWAQKSKSLAKWNNLVPHLHPSIVTEEDLVAPNLWDQHVAMRQVRGDSSAASIKCMPKRQFRGSLRYNPYHKQTRRDS